MASSSAGGIHPAGRLVEREELRLCGEGARDERALALAAGQCAEGAAGEVFDADARQGVAYRRVVARPGPAPGGEQAVAPHHRHLGDGERPRGVDMVALRDVADPEPRPPSAAPGEHRLHAEQRAQEGGLPAAVRADDGEEVAG